VIDCRPDHWSSIPEWGTDSFSVPYLKLVLEESSNIPFNGHRSHCRKTKQAEAELHLYLQPRSREKGGALSPLPNVFLWFGDQTQGELNVSLQQDDSSDKVSELY
jgi:hypothetical protein